MMPMESQRWDSRILQSLELTYDQTISTATESAIVGSDY